jgi:drug/metabolite transporter (DMT)-like permease
MSDRARPVDAGNGSAAAASAPGALSQPMKVRLLLGLVFASVGLQLVNAMLVKLASGSPSPPLLVVGAILAAVLLLSFVRFFIWNGIYRRYPISLAYPLSAIFFPGVVLVAWAMDEPVGIPQLVGATLVMVGVIRFVAPGPGEPAPAELPIIE